MPHFGVKMKAELEFRHVTIPAYLLKYSIKLFINEIKLGIKFSIYNWIVCLVDESSTYLALALLAQVLTEVLKWA